MSWESRAPCGNKLMVFITAESPCLTQGRLFTIHVAKKLWPTLVWEGKKSMQDWEEITFFNSSLGRAQQRGDPEYINAEAKQGTTNSLFLTMLALPRLQKHQQRAWSNNFPSDFYSQDLQHSLSNIYVLGINRQVQNPIPHPRKERGWFILTAEN